MVRKRMKTGQVGVHISKWLGELTWEDEISKKRVQRPKLHCISPHQITGMQLGFKTTCTCRRSSYSSCAMMPLGSSCMGKSVNLTIDAV